MLAVLAMFCAVALAEGLGLTPALLDWVGDRYGIAAQLRVEQLQALLDGARDTSERDKLDQINRFFNRIPYDSDWDLWDREDYWATPLEMLGIHGADCEDYAIAKYFALRELSVPAARLRITYVKVITLNQSHMVLAYYANPQAEPLILDNLKDEIRAAGDRVDLVPVYSFNGEGLWLSKQRARGKRVGSASRIKRWNSLRDKMVQENGAMLQKPADSAARETL